MPYPGESTIKRGSRKIVQEAMNEGKGVILVFGHLGNWELLGIVCEMLNIKGMIVTSQIGDKNWLHF